MAQIRGTNQADVLSGLNQNDTIEGRKGEDTLTGGGGQDTFIIRAGDGVDAIADFSGVGPGIQPAPDVIAEADILKFEGAGLTPENLILTFTGESLQLRFEGVENTGADLSSAGYLGLAPEALDNLTKASGAKLDLGNILFDGQTQIQDSFDVIDRNQTLARVHHANTVTFLNDLNNTTTGLNNSDDVINAQAGNDILNGFSGDDLLRGELGSDLLIGGAGDDKLIGGSDDDFLQAGPGRDVLTGGSGSDRFILTPQSGSILGGVDVIQDFQEGQDLIELAPGLGFDRLQIAQGTGVHSNDTVITQATGPLALLQGVDASSLSREDFVEPIRSFKLSKIVDTRGKFDTILTSDLNDKGSVVFAARLDSDDPDSFEPDGLFLAEAPGQLIKTILAPNDSSLQLAPNRIGDAINNQNTVAFSAFPAGGGTGIYTRNGSVTKTIASTSDPSTGLVGPSINDAGQVAYTQYDTSNPGEAEAVYVGDGTTRKQIVNTKGEFASFDFFADINNSGTVAFVARPDQGAEGIYTSNGTTTRKLIDASGPFASFVAPQINNAGTVVFRSALDAGSEGIYTTDGTKTTTIADSSGPFTTFNDLAINDDDSVVFQATLDNGSRGIFTGSDRVADRVITLGDSLMGSRVRDLRGVGLNNVGEVVFEALLTNGTLGIFAAEPVPLG